MKGKKPQSYLLFGEELSSTCVCLIGDTGQFPSPQGTLILSGLHRTVPCDHRDSALAFHFNWAALVS